MSLDTTPTESAAPRSTATTVTLPAADPGETLARQALTLQSTGQMPLQRAMLLRNYSLNTLPAVYLSTLTKIQ